MASHRIQPYDWFTPKICVCISGTYKIPIYFTQTLGASNTTTCCHRPHSRNVNCELFMFSPTPPLPVPPFKGASGTPTALVPRTICHCWYYRPQRSWAKVILSQACVKNSVHRGGGCLPQCMLGYTPRSRPPQEQTPRTRHTPPGADTPPAGADSAIPSTSGRYASYWNAFLYLLFYFFSYLSQVCVSISKSASRSARSGVSSRQ